MGPVSWISFFTLASLYRSGHHLWIFNSQIWLNVGHPTRIEAWPITSKHDYSCVLVVSKGYSETWGGKPSNFWGGAGGRLSDILRPSLHLWPQPESAAGGPSCHDLVTMVCTGNIPSCLGVLLRPSSQTFPQNSVSSRGPGTDSPWILRTHCTRDLKCFRNVWQN